jgi:lysophospholipase L1-like esterase
MSLSGYAIVNETPSGTNIIAFGDSLTEGIGAGEGESYPDQLSARIGIPILNRGVSGETTADAMARLEEDVLSQDPKIVLLCLGGNDVLKRSPVEETFANLERMITRIQETGALVILIGVSGSLIYPQYDDEFEKLARKTGCPLVPEILANMRSDGLLADQVHPNARGYGVFCDRVEPVLRKFLE